MKKIIKRNSGFSLIELLIVIAIIGVLSVLAFSMFTGVLHNSRKKADEHQALVIQKAVISYMLQSQDFKLQNLLYDGYTLPQSMDGKLSSELVYALQSTITCTIDGKNLEIYPILSPKSGASPSTTCYAPFWSTSNGGQYKGYKIEVLSNEVNCHVTPVTNADEAKVYVN
ncbi:type II secretion system protein [Acetivibrio cellulolyticus]|uniref:type II secretion system protein n=1 Tax=Acetivibrio cellulolyticus TaxID=35830 RepID=UPI0001E2D8A2|nr:type II secretion system protein [Acetivibrio cellulolyticus]